MSERIAIIKSIRVFLIDKSGTYAIADTLKLSNQVWTATKDSRDVALFEAAGNPGDYALLIARLLEQQFPVKVEVIDSNHNFETFLFTAKFKLEFVEVPPTAPADMLDDHTAAQLFAQISEALSGSAAGGFSGTIRMENIDDTQAETLAINYFKAVARFCLTCSCTWRRLKNGAASIRIVAGEARTAV